MKVRILMICLLMVFVGASTKVFGQDPIFGNRPVVSSSLPFFQNQGKAMDQWLKGQGWSSFIGVHEVEIREDSLLVFFEFKKDDLDWQVNAWNKLKETYESVSPLRFEQFLFYRALHFMEVQDANLHVVFYSGYDYEGWNRPFYRGIFWDGIKVAVEEDNPKAKVGYIEVGEVITDRLRNPASCKINKRVAKTVLYDQIYQLAKGRFNSPKCYFGRPSMGKLEDYETLRFEVFNVCNEVLPTVGIISKKTKREALSFVISVVEEEDRLLVLVSVDGTYGSGNRPSAPLSNFNDMEIEYGDELQRYAIEMANYFGKNLQ